MPFFGKASEEKLSQLHPKLVTVARTVIQVMDFTVVYTLRSPEEQKFLLSIGQSKTLDSKHLLQPDGFAWAIDVAPFYAWKRPQIDWNDKKAFYYLAGMFVQAAYLLDVNIRYGGDWNMNDDLNDQTFFDLGHFELLTV